MASRVGLLGACLGRINHVGPLVRPNRIEQPQTGLIFQRSPARRFIATAPATLFVPRGRLHHIIGPGRIAKIHKRTGDWVEAGEAIVSIEVDMIDIIFGAPANGTITELPVQEGNVVVGGQALARIDTGASSEMQLQTQGSWTGRAQKPYLQRMDEVIIPEAT